MKKLAPLWNASCCGGCCFAMAQSGLSHIAERTRAALAAAKARDVELGVPRSAGATVRPPTRMLKPCVRS
jgi:DNA invertase Pin-like site-specific DNA recombinase